MISVGRSKFLGVPRAALLYLALFACAGCSVHAGLPEAAAGAASGITTGWMSPEAKRNEHLLYVGNELANAIEIYPQKGSNQQPIGAITQGIDEPDGLFVDRHGKLYVCNFRNGTITVYPRGEMMPAETLANAGHPASVVVGPDGAVYVADYEAGAYGRVLKYFKGHTKPAWRIVV